MSGLGRPAAEVYANLLENAKYYEISWLACNDTLFQKFLEKQQILM
jgi:hypothetical protein